MGTSWSSSQNTGSDRCLIHFAPFSFSWAPRGVRCPNYFGHRSVGFSIPTEPLGDLPGCILADQGTWGVYDQMAYGRFNSGSSSSWGTISRLAGQEILQLSVVPRKFIKLFTTRSCPDAVASSSLSRSHVFKINVPKCRGWVVTPPSHSGGSGFKSWPSYWLLLLQPFVVFLGPTQANAAIIVCLKSPFISRPVWVYSPNRC
jgi:hypothetical protein